MESFCIIGKRGMIMIAKPVISPDFTVEDIHRIREYHYELTKDMTTQERINFYNEGGRAFLRKWKRKSCRRYNFKQFNILKAPTDELIELIPKS